MQEGLYHGSGTWNENIIGRSCELPEVYAEPVGSEHRETVLAYGFCVLALGDRLVNTSREIRPISFHRRFLTFQLIVLEFRR